MKLHSLILVLFAINLVNIAVSFSLESDDITDLTPMMTSWFDNSDGKFISFTSNVREQDNWFLEKTEDIAQGFTSAINLVVIGFQLVSLILWSWFNPTYRILFSGEAIPFLQFLGYLASLYLSWFNIMLIAKLIGFMKTGD